MALAKRIADKRTELTELESRLKAMDQQFNRIHVECYIINEVNRVRKSHVHVCFDDKHNLRYFQIEYSNHGRDEDYVYFNSKDVYLNKQAAFEEAEKRIKDIIKVQEDISRCNTKFALE